MEKGRWSQLHENERFHDWLLLDFLLLVLLFRLQILQDVPQM